LLRAPGVALVVLDRRGLFLVPERSQETKRREYHEVVDDNHLNGWIRMVSWTGN